MIGTPHPMALTITLLIIAEQRQHTTFEYAVYEVLNRYMELKDWPEAKRSDLYAQIAEQYKPTNSIAVNTQIVSDCIWRTEEHFNG
jgi:hypothetical protein